MGRHCRGASPAVWGWGSGGGAAEAHWAGSHLGEAHRGQQDLGDPPAPAEPIAQMRVLPNQLPGLSHLGWTPSSYCFLSPRALRSPSHLPVRGTPASPECGTRLGEEDSHYRLLGSLGIKVWG